ncbi:5-(carboxyamino)imidazole ribonucleotide synthase [Sulfolobus acidocaldarius]|uniref:N5-carboxyaminoimidazole ribonucleotide synthase n=4 Tax=Sulfolobus acidocaldarius TaxID=2285 RepID=Q4J9J2_SULAC|nr:5-(carboxyamino)imidazole ribonucleotide synthase [Sulfolobus acidocaldarius]AAY80538.1 phosphoribosylaminoimidazole carboxylase ATPase [Sulfolobus acidocaldarius DSM 639]AGE71127.1 phosphoribosylaminoimidazole carboxylase ATPase subunit [Sulfolobus acidocaldarius N8]AGE73397.1 phosphoribosylaminoimidazole carboxylase ATPase subunit [Sulfolobus acidocaldarius Ron12/I]ALU28599.1 phosphoribosylaminoimidazole carboxylase [Sulfolobus acidocaldarius]ALU31313.1 phosphoribosylaminoimidazole carbox
MKSLTRNYLKIGILGGGQLGWMMILEGRKYPFTFYVLDDPNTPGCRIADKCFPPEKYKEMIDEVDVVTFEFEHVLDKALEYAQEKEKLFPGINSVELKRERYKEKLYYKEHNLPTPRFLVAEDGEEALKILKEEFNGIGVLKESLGGYDGKGQYFIKGDVNKYENLKSKKVKFVVEEFVNFNYEASIIAMRDKNGNFKAYPPTFNYNEKGILVYNYGPLHDNRFEEIAKRLADSLNYVGTMGIEFFVRDGEILINEFAPRVHNTGHYTLDSAYISQFEQHIRAITGIELGSTELLTFGGMVNILGTDDVPPEVLRYGKVYWYGKPDVKKRRKMGHVNVIGKDLEEVKQKIDIIMKLIYKQGLDL